MARLWQAGPHFNTTTGDVEFTTYSGTLSVQSTVTRLGPFAIRTNPAANSGFVRQVIYAADSSTNVFTRGYVRFASFPTADCTIFRISNLANNPCAQIRFINSTSKLVMLDSAATQVGGTSVTLSLNTWYRLEVNLDASTSPGSLTARLDGTQFATGASPAQAPWQRILWGPVTSTTTDIYWCDFAVNDTSGSFQNTWPGSGAVVAIFPDSAGDANGWNNTANAAGGTTNWQLVDENPPNDATDMVQTGTLNTEDMYNMSASGIGSSDTINVVAVGARFRNNLADTIAAMKVQVKKTSGGTILQSAAISPNDTGWQTNTPIQPRNYPIVTYLDPDNSVAWTQTTVDSMQVGQKLTTANTNRIQVTSVWASIDYTPSTTTPISGTDTGAGVDAGSVAAAVAATETAAGADTTALSATTTAAETGAAADAGTVSAALPGTETGSGTDAGSVGAAIPQADTGVGVDTASLSASLSATETAAGVEATSLTVFAFETATGVDTTALAVTQSNSDTGSAVDAGSLAAAQSNGDNATGVDAASVSVSITVAETGTGVDTEQVAQGTVPISASDTASGTDTASLLASIAASETGTSLDGLTDRTLGSNEAGTGTDASTISATLSSGDTASAAQAEVLAASPAASEDVSADDAITVLTASLSATDIATALETFFVEGGDDQTVFADDVVASTDDGIVAAGIVFDDPAASIETTSVFVAILVSDVAVATEGAPRIGLSSADTITVTDNAAPFATLATTDSGAAIDATNNLSATTSSSDSGAGVESTPALQAAVSSGDSGAGAETSPAPPASMVISDSASGADILAIKASASSTDAATSIHQAFISATIIANTDTATGTDNASFAENPLVSIFAADQASAVDLAHAVINIFSGDIGSIADLSSFFSLKTSGDAATGAELTSILVSISATDAGRGRDSADIFIKPTRSHRVMPYYIREPQDWAIEQERRRHNEALWYIGENTMFALMWHLEDFQDGLVGRCPTCYESQGRIATVYGQADEYKCPDCFGTTFEGGFKALIVRPAIFSDSDEGETRQARGVVHPQDLTIESTPDFRIRSGDYCFRVNGDRYYMRVPERITLRTGFGHATQTGTAIGYNHANAAVEDPDSVAYLIPPTNDEVSQILGRASRIPRDWSTFEVIRAPLIPTSDLIGGS